MFLNELILISSDWHINFNSTNFLLKINANIKIDVKNKYVKNSCEKFNVAKFERFVFVLIENKSDFNVIKREINFYFRIYENVML